jgi:hypothetical protein
VVELIRSAELSGVPYAYAAVAGSLVCSPPARRAVLGCPEQVVEVEAIAVR